MSIAFNAFDIGESFTVLVFATFTFCIPLKNVVYAVLTHVQSGLSSQWIGTDGGNKPTGRPTSDLNSINLDTYVSDKVAELE